MGGIQQPLLAEESKEEVPSLSGPSSAEEEDTPLSRLIAESTPQEALAPYSPMIDETTTSNTAAVAVSSYTEASLITILSGTLIVLCWGFIWGAFFSNSWMDSHLFISIGWQQKYLPWLDKHTDLVIQESSVFTLSANLEEQKQYFSLLGLWICSILLPCVFMIVCPIWILTDHTLPQGIRKEAAESQTSRWCLELGIRLSLLVIFILLFLNVAISGIELNWEDTNLKMQNQLRGPFISYLLGCTCAMLSVVILRMPFLNHLNLLGYSWQQPRQNNSNNIRQREDVSPQAARVPPARAFRLPWLSSNDDLDAITAESETEPMVPEPQRNTTSIQQPASSLNHIPIWQRIVLYQLGVLAFLLWFPTLVLGQFRVLYGGLVVDLVKNKAFNVYLWQIPSMVWQSGMKAGTPDWMMIAIFILLFLFVLVLPLMAHWVAVMMWMRQGNNRDQWRDILRLLHPTLCGIPFAIALLVTVPSFINIGENLDRDICQQIENVVQNQCLISGGVRLAGSWFLLAQTIILELFVLLTLRWTSPK